MKTLLRHTIGPFVLSALTLASRPAQAQGPHLPTPVWDQTFECTTRATCPRFIVLSNLFDGAAVLDRETGLVWQQSPSPNLVNWFVARNSCLNQPIGGRLGWRLPSVLELASLVDKSVPPSRPTLPPGHPFSNVQAGSYWSATTLAADPFFTDASTVAWIVFFDVGQVGYANKSDSHFVWCVRGEMNADQY